MTQDKREKRNYFRSTKDTLNSLLFVLPLMIFYQIGIYFYRNDLNGVDVFTPLILNYWGNQGLMFFHFGLILTFVTIYAVVQKKEVFPAHYTFFIIFEGILYSFLMAFVITLITHFSPHNWKIPAACTSILLFLPYIYFYLKEREDSQFSRMVMVVCELIILLLIIISAVAVIKRALLVDWSAAANQGDAFQRLLWSVGAGVNEEIVFRLIIFGTLFTTFTKQLQWGEFPSFLVAALISAALFSGAHHLAGEAFEIQVFVYRLLAGVVFSIIFVTRGFAATVYTHTLYDLLIFFRDHWVVS